MHADQSCCLFARLLAGEAVCVHLRAAAEVVGFTHELRVAAASCLVQRNGIQVDAATGICRCSTLADILKPVHFRPQDGSCTCHDRAMHGTCCHLLAAAQLPVFAGMELPTGAAVAEDEAGKVGPLVWMS